MKRLLPLLALGLLAGCVTYPEYGYYNDGRSYDSYYYDDGGDYYYSTRPDRYYYDDGYYGYYGYGPYSYGLGGYGYGGYGYGYGFGSYPYIGFGFSSGYYPYGGYYGGFGSYYGGYYGHRRSHRHDDRRDGHDNRSAYDNRWPGGRDRSSQRGDGVIDNDAGNLADQIARERGVRDPTPRSHAPGAGAQGSYPGGQARGNYSRERDVGSANGRDGWRSDYRDAQLASPRAAAAGGLYSRSPSAATQLRGDPVQPRGDWRQQPAYREQSMPPGQSPQEWRGPDPRAARGGDSQRWSRGPDAQPPRMESAPRQSYASPRFESAPQRFSQPAPQPRVESRGDDRGSSGNHSRERDVNDRR